MKYIKKYEEKPNIDRLNLVNFVKDERGYITDSDIERLLSFIMTNHYHNILNAKDNEGNTALIHSVNKYTIVYPKNVVYPKTPLDELKLGAVGIKSKPSFNNRFLYLLLKTAPFLKLNIQNKYGETALIKAAINGNIEAVKMLIKAGADWNKKDKRGKEFFDYLKIYKKKIIIEDCPDEYLFYINKKKFNV